MPNTVKDTRHRYTNIPLLTTRESRKDRSTRDREDYENVAMVIVTSRGLVLLLKSACGELYLITDPKGINGAHEGYY